MTRNEIKGIRKKYTDYFNKKIEEIKKDPSVIHTLDTLEADVILHSNSIVSNVFITLSTPDSFIMEMNRLKDKISRLPIHTDGQFLYEPTTDYNENHVWNNHIAYEYKIPNNYINDRALTAFIENKLKEDIRPIRATQTKTPKWSDIQLYVDGDIEWNDLVDRTYPTTITTSHFVWKYL